MLDIITSDEPEEVAIHNKRGLWKVDTSTVKNEVGSGINSNADADYYHFMKPFNLRVQSNDPLL
jgi:hypothetical protein